jgi:hypothetical protein
MRTTKYILSENGMTEETVWRAMRRTRRAAVDAATSIYRYRMWMLTIERRTTTFYMALRLIHSHNKRFFFFELREWYIVIV